MTYSRLSFPQSDIALIELDHPTSRVNLLARPLLAELEQHFVSLADRKDVVGLIIASAKPGSFVAGADLKEFAAGLDRPETEVQETSRAGQQLFSQLQHLPQVTVAAIDGVCVGGGAELATWCDRRVAVDQPATQIGFPEVKLGLFPGWGGTARLPRVVGLPAAVEMITGGESLTARAAYQLGLVDDLVPTATQLLPAAERLIRSEVSSRQYERDRATRRQPINIRENELGFLGATASALIQQQTHGHYPAPMAALELLLEASQMDLDAALELEAERFAPLFGSPVNRGLLNVFFLQDRNKKQAAGKSDIAHVSVIGAGTMGRGIAGVCLRRGLHVAIDDARQETLPAALRDIVERAAFDRERKGPDPAKVLELAPQLVAAKPSTVTDLLIEAIVEDIGAKRELLSEVAQQLPSAILASNTSTIPISKLAEGMPSPERVCGLHFFNPVHKMPLVEVIRGRETSEATMTRAVAFARQLGKSPIVVADGPGFLVNRLLLPYMNEALLLASEGVPLQKIDRTAREFGMPMGPIELHDVVGLDVCLHAGHVMGVAFADRTVEVPLLGGLVAAGRLGQKNGRGFFDWQQKKGKWKSTPSDDVAKLIREHQQPSTSDAPLIDRLILPMLLEAVRALDDEIVSDPRDVDLALILGIGFPPFRGGLLYWADQLGLPEVLSRLERLTPLGARFAAPATLTAMAKRNATFYETVGRERPGSRPVPSS